MKFKDELKKEMDTLEPSREALDGVREKTARGRAVSRAWRGRLVSACLLLTLTVGTIFAAGYFTKSEVTTPPAVDNTASSALAPSKSNDDYSDVFKLLSAAPEALRGAADYTYGIPKGDFQNSELEKGSPQVIVPSGADVNGGKKLDYSDTNLQTIGVQEADIISTDGKYIYVVSNRKVIIVSVDGEKLAIVSEIKNAGNDNEVIDQIYITDNRLIILVHRFEYEELRQPDETNGDVSAPEKTDIMIDYIPYFYSSKTFLTAQIYDIADRTQPKLISSLGQSGDYVSSRMIGDILYLFTSQYVYNIDEKRKETYVPQLINNGNNSFIPSDCIYLPEKSKSSSYLNAQGIDTAKAESVSSLSVLGCGYQLYASMENVYVSFDDYYTLETETTNDTKYVENGSNTNIYKFSIKDGKIEYKVTGTIPGQLLNQFSLDEYDGNLRVVTTTNKWAYYSKTSGDDGEGGSFIPTNDEDIAQTNALYVLNDKLEIIGSITGLAKDERVYSVRFDGAIGYFVTFRQVDPLFSVDLSNPKEPKILGELKIPGFSSYMHPYTDNLLFGFGMAADESTGRTQGLKLSMFDVTDKTNIKELHTLTLPEGWSEASYNHKAILVNGEKNIIGFGAEDKYYVFEYSVQDGFKQIAEFNDNMSYSLRGIYIEDNLYIISESGISVCSLNNGEYVSSLNFN